MRECRQFKRKDKEINEILREKKKAPKSCVCMCICVYIRLGDPVVSCL